MIKKLSILLFLVSTTLTLAQSGVDPSVIVRGENPNYAKVETGSFGLYYLRRDQNIDKRIASLVLKKFADDYTICLNQELECVLNPRTKKSVIIYESRDDFLKGSGLDKRGGAGSNVSACYLSDVNAIAIDGESWRKKPKNFFEILSHETGHMAVAELCGGVGETNIFFPRSLDEGLSLSRERLKRYGTVADSYMDHIDRGSRKYTASELLFESTDHYPFALDNYKEKAAFYRQSASLVEFLVKKLGSKNKVVHFGLAAGRANNKIEREEMLKKFGIENLKNLEKEWYNYERNKILNYVR